MADNIEQQMFGTILAQPGQPGIATFPGMPPIRSFDTQLREQATRRGIPSRALHAQIGESVLNMFDGKLPGVVKNVVPGELIQALMSNGDWDTEDIKRWLAMNPMMDKHYADPKTQLTWPPKE